MHIHVYGDTLCAQVTATAMAQTGHQVHWFLPEGVAWDTVRKDGALYRELELPFLLEEQRRAGRLVCERITTGEAASPSADILFLALQPGKLKLACEILDGHRQAAPRIIINQGAGPVGTAEALQAHAKSVDPALVVVALPDLVQEGNAFNTFTRPDSLLLGCESADAEALVRELLRPFNRRRDVIQVMSLREAEFSKLAISGILATRLSFMNDMAQLAESLNVDIDQVRKAMGSDSRVGDAYLYPGCGFGGPGLDRSVMTLIDALQSRDRGTGLLEHVLHINERQKEVLFRKFWQYFQGNVAGKRVAIWGTSFKPGTHRVENGAAVKTIEALWAQGVEVAVHDPLALQELSRWAEGKGELQLCEDPYAAAKGADALMLITEWKSYWSPDWASLKSSMREPLVLDGRNIYDPQYLRSQGFRYMGVGR